MLDWESSQAFWLYVVNIALGLAVLTAFLAITYGVALELVARLKKRGLVVRRGQP